jgi:hypothetical protein
MDALIAPLTAGAVGAQHAVHGSYRAQVDTLIEQRGMHARRRHVGETLAVESVQHELVLCVVQRQGWARTQRARTLRPDECAMASVGASARPLARGCAAPQAHGGAGSRVAQDWSEFVHGRHHGFSLLSLFRVSSSVASFFWTPITSIALSSSR